MKKIFRCITFSILLMLIYQSSAFALQKNVTSQKWIVFAFTASTNLPALDDEAQITATLNIDGGADNAVDDTNPAELGGGYYVFDLSQAETNGDYIVIRPDSSTSGIEVIGCPAALWTTPPGFNTLTAPAIQTELEENGASKLDTITDKLPTNYIMGSAVQTDKDDDIDAILVDTAAVDTTTEMRTFLTGGDNPLSILIATDNIGINWADVAAPTTAVNLSGTNIKTDQVVASVSGAVGSVTGAVGSITGITFPANFGVLSISATTGLVDITQTAADKVWSTAARTLTASTNFTLLTAQQVWEYATRVLTANTNLNDLNAAGVAAAVWNAATASYGSANTYGALVETNLDVAISTRGTSTLTAQNVWEYATRVLTAATNLPFITVANIWETDISAYSGAKAGTYLKGVYDKLPAGTIGTSTYAGADTTGTTTLVGLLTSARAGYLDKLNVTGTLANTDNAASFKATGFSTPTDISNLQTHGDSTWATATGFSTLTAQQVWEYATRALTDKGNFTLASSEYTNIWNKDISGYSTSGYAGTYLKSAGGAADPWLTALPGEYSAGTAGYIIGTNLNATVGSRSTLTAQNVWEYTTRALTDKSGFALTQAFPSNFSAMVISALGKVTVGTNDDKTGYTASTVSDKTGYSLAADQAVNVTKWLGAAAPAMSGDAYSILNNGTYGNNALFTAIGTRMATFTYTAPDNTGITNIYNIVNSGTYGNSALLTAIGTRAPASTALSNVTWTDAKAAFLDALISSRSTLTAAAVWGYVGDREITGGTVDTVTDPVTLNGTLAY